MCLIFYATNTEAISALELCKVTAWLANGGSSNSISSSLRSVALLYLILEPSRDAYVGIVKIDVVKNIFSYYSGFYIHYTVLSHTS